MRKGSAVSILVLMAVFTCVSFAACGGSIGGKDASQERDTVTGDTDAEDSVDISVDRQDSDAPPPHPLKKVDILVVVDDSGSMAAEQNNLQAAMPALIGALLDPPVDPGTGERVHEPVRDIHVGVVSTNMGAGGYPVSGCAGIVGDDGILLHEPHGAVCDPSYPDYLGYMIGETDEPELTAIEKLSRDFGCIALLGTNGCGFEQQLEAAHKALTIHAGTGGPNAGFLRDDTIVVIVFITDEEDCSAEDNTIFDLSGLTYPVNLRCFNEKDRLHSVSRYAESFSALRSSPEHVVVGMIVGVPLDSACNGRGSRLEGCLDTAAMQEVIRPDGELLEYVCKYPPECSPPAGNCLTEAFPARRFVELAQLMGDSAIVQSICTSNFGPPMEAIAERIAEVIAQD